MKTDVMTEKQEMKAKTNYYNRNKRFSYQAFFYSCIGLALTIIYLIIFVK